MKESIPALKEKGKTLKDGQAKADNTEDVPLFALNIDGEVRKVTPEKLLKQKFADKLQKECEQAEKPVAVRLTNLLDFTDEERWAVLDFVAGLSSYRPKVGKENYTDLFDAVLAVMVNDDDISLACKAKLAALEVAVLKFPDALDIPCNRILTRMRELGFKGIKIADLLKDAKHIATMISKAAPSKAESTLQKVKELFPNAPVSAEVAVPSGWQLSPAGLGRTNGDEGGQTIAAPVLIIERGQDIHKGTELVTLAWHRENKWQTEVTERKVIANARTIVELAASGLPVTSNNARMLVQYLDDFEAENLARLPVTRISHKMGWQGTDGKDGFLWGRNLITAKGLVADTTEIIAGTSGKGNRVRFRGADEGDDQLADGFHQSGTFKGWVKSVKRVRHHPRALVGFYAGFVPPMLPILETFNHVIDFAGQTTSGKTTVLRVAASVWGNPDERSAGAVVSTWNCTATWRERVPAVCCHLPLILDDTKNVRFPDEVAKTIYGITQGRGRGRGTIKGVAEQASAETVLFSSGEQPATSFTKDGGTRPRVLSFWGSPFGETSPEMGERIRKINEGICKHYGHAGPRFVQYILQQKEEWKGWREWYKEWVQYYEENAEDDVIAGRMATHFAAITVTSYFVHQALNLPWIWTNPLEPVWEELISVSAEADVAARALLLVVNWAIAHRQDFFYYNQTESIQPHGGWLGRWDKNTGSVKKWAWIGIFPHLLEEVLREGGFDPDATVRTWRDREWIEVDAEGQGKGRNTKRVQVGKDLARLVALRRKAVVALNGSETV